MIERARARTPAPCSLASPAHRELPAELRAAAKRLTLFSRLALYRMVEDARKEWVDVLPPPVSKPLLLILRGDADP